MASAELALAFFIIHTLRTINAQGTFAVLGVQHPVTVTDSSEGHLRSSESLLSFKCILSYILSAFFLLVLPATLLLFLALEIVTHLSGVLVCRVTLSDKGIMLRHQSIVFLFQLGGLRLQIALLRHFPFDVVRLDMLGNVLVGFFKCVDSGSILLAETLLFS